MMWADCTPVAAEQGDSDERDRWGRRRFKTWLFEMHDFPCKQIMWRVAVIGLVTWLGSMRAPPARAEVTFLNAWGTLGSGNGQFDQPWFAAVNAGGQVYIGDSQNDRVQRFDAFGNFELSWGSFGTGNGQFNTPAGVAVNASGQVYVADINNERIQRFDADGNFELAWGTAGTGNGQFSGPFGIAIAPSGQVYTTELFNDRIQRFDANGNFELKWGATGNGLGQFDTANAVAVDSSGQVYVADTLNSRIQRFDADGMFPLAWGTNGSGNGQFDLPRGVATSANGLVYVGDWDNDRVQRFDADGNFDLTWGSAGGGDGQFTFTRGPAVSSSGLVYVPDQGNDRVQRFLDTDAWVSGTNTFTDAGVGPTSVAVGLGEILGETFTLGPSRGLVVGDTTTVQSGGTLTLAGGSFTTAALVVADGGALTVATTGSTSADATVAGSLTLDPGFQFDLDGTSTFEATASVQLGTGGQLRIGGASTIKSGAVVSGDGQLNVLSTAVLNLQNGANVGVSVTNDGEVQPGLSTGAATVAAYTQGATAALALEINGPLPAADFDVLNVTGAANLDGQLDVSLGVTPAHGETFAVMTFASRTGVFSSVTDSGLPNMLVMAPFYTATDLTLRVSLLGDANGNGKVEAADYTLWANNFGASEPSYDEGDLNRDGSVDPADYTLWANNFGATVMGPQSGAQAVPEPSTLTLLSVAVIGFALARRWRRGSAA